jgi:hypothetical protein
MPPPACAPADADSSRPTLAEAGTAGTELRARARRSRALLGPRVSTPAPDFPGPSAIAGPPSGRWLARAGPAPVPPATRVRSCSETPWPPCTAQPLFRRRRRACGPPAPPPFRGVGRPGAIPAPCHPRGDERAHPRPASRASAGRIATVHVDPGFCRRGRSLVRSLR